MNTINLFTEKWKIISNFSNYAVSNHGRVMRITPAQHTHPGKILRLVNNKGYICTRLYLKSKLHLKTVHRLVIKAFLGPCPRGKETNHKSGIKTDNRIENLEYLTHSENQKHAIKIGIRKVLKGTEISNSKLKEKDVLEIVRLRQIGLSINKVSKKFNVSPRLICWIMSGDKWNWLTKIKLNF